jgi:D-3-phosphoglycerate dehydrogenase / 2-oxoglutarate reductase
VSGAVSTATVLVTATGFSQRCAEGFAALQAAGVRVVENPHGRPLTPTELHPLLADVEAVIAGVDAWDAAALAAAPRLRVIARFGVGLDNIDQEEAARRGVVVRNVPGGNANAVAELTLGLMLAGLRGIVDLHLSTRAGAWSRFVGRELAGRTVGLVGFGDIARRVARLLRAFGCTVIAHDPYAARDAAWQEMVTLVPLEALLARSDVVSLHAPATPATEGMVDEAFLAGMRPDALLVNTARGALVDERALVAALDAGHIAGAAVDVYQREPAAPGDPLVGHPKVITTPHTAAETAETYARVGAATATIVLEALEAAGRVSVPGTGRSVHTGG